MEATVVNFTIAFWVTGHKIFMEGKFHHWWIQPGGHPFNVPSLVLVQEENQLSIWMRIDFLTELALRDGTLKGWPPGYIHLWWNFPSMKVSWPATRGAMVKFTTVAPMENTILKDDWMCIFNKTSIKKG